ncbi:MAG: hypothetical protein EPO62_06110 [Candidatus Nitrosotenuis sp.]|nr:MAG: hypothetical protein EPO62_06110 [Candidatus Nitrosotenuis sp.]
MNSIIILMFSIVLFSYVMSGQASACECKDLKEESSYLSDSDSIFLGKVRNIEKTNDEYPSYLIRFDVDKSWKGTNTKEISIKSSMDSGACAYSFEINQVLIVHAQQENGTLQEKSCGTLPAEYVADHIQFLDEHIQNNLGNTQVDLHNFLLVSVIGIPVLMGAIGFIIWSKRK